MGVGDENMRKRLVADRLEKGAEMRLVLGARIDERKGLLAEDEARRAGEGERAGIATHHPPDNRGQVFRGAVGGGKIPVKGEARLIGHRRPHLRKWSE